MKKHRKEKENRFETQWILTLQLYYEYVVYYTKLCLYGMLYVCVCVVVVCAWEKIWGIFSCHRQ